MTRDGQEELATCVLPGWGRWQVADVSKGDIQQLLEDVPSGKLAARGKPTKVARRNPKALLANVFDWAADRGAVPGNPAAAVKLPGTVREHQKKGGRDRVLSE